MVDTLQNICDKLGVYYPDIDNYQYDCDKAQYLINQISNMLGGN